MKKVFKLLTVTVFVLALNTSYGQEVKNVIFMIGDGMGLTHLQATMMRSGTPLNMERAQYIGLSKTYSANNRVTDSAAGGTALSTGYKTNNGMICVTPDGTPVENLREKAQKKGLSTGVVVTKDITDATPATFMVHVDSRKKADEIAADIVDCGVDVFMGGGKSHFSARPDSVDLIAALKAKGYRIVNKDTDLSKVTEPKVAGFYAAKHLKRAIDGRGSYLVDATRMSLEVLGKNAKGFFLMVEGSQIDTGSHANDGEFVIGEMLDFDAAVGAAFDFADRNPGTLVIVTADHETGGITLPSGSEDFTLSDQGVELRFSSKNHTAVMVPIYAYGAGAGNFTRIMENTEIPKIIAKIAGY